MWFIIPREEQETTINIDYCEKKMMFYTSRKTVAKRIEKKVGKPTRIDYTNGQISGVTYIRNLYDEDVKKFLSVSAIIGGFRKENNLDDKLIKEN